MAELEKRIAQLEQELGRLTASTPAPGDRAVPVLRVRGIVIEDAEGRARILLGAPAPNVPDRKRMDSTTSLILLDEKGNDRLVVGYVPDQQVKGQIEARGTAVVGMALCDQDGNERGGFGIFDASGSVGIGLDYPGGREAVSLFAMSNGVAGFSISDRRLEERILLAFNGDDDTPLVNIPEAHGK